jgi:hypothetical protein
MPKAATKSKKVVKKASKPAARPAARTTKSSHHVPLHKRHFFKEHQDQLHAENPNLRLLLYIMLFITVVLIAQMFMYGWNNGMWSALY